MTALMITLSICSAAGGAIYMIWSLESGNSK